MSTIAVANITRERDFADFIQFADEMELLRQRQLIAQELKSKFANVRNPLSELLRDRLKVLNQTLGLAA